MTFGRLIDMKKQGKLEAQILLQIDNHEVWGECGAFNSPFDPAAGKLADCFNTVTMCIYVEFSIIKKNIKKNTGPTFKNSPLCPGGHGGLGFSWQMH